MANYIAHYTKKKQILARRELDLKRLIERGAPTDTLIAAAEKVRDARIRVLQARRATIVPEGDALVRFAKIDLRIEATAAKSPIHILDEFRCDLT